MKSTDGCKLEDVCSVEIAKLYKEFESINMTGENPNAKSRMEEIRLATLKDEELKKETKFIKTGWPSERKIVPAQLIPYYHVKDQLVEENGIFKGDRVVIPRKQREEAIEKIQYSHWDRGLSKTCTRIRLLAQQK